MGQHILSTSAYIHSNTNKGTLFTLALSKHNGGVSSPFQDKPDFDAKNHSKV